LKPPTNLYWILGEQISPVPTAGWRLTAAATPLGFSGVVFFFPPRTDVELGWYLVDHHLLMVFPTVNSI